MIKDEIDFESAHGIVPNEHDDNELPRNERARSSTPMHADLDEDLLRRFDALGGLELPPVPKMDPRVKSRPPTELDETDTWCCELHNILSIYMIAQRPILNTPPGRYMQ